MDNASWLIMTARDTCRLTSSPLALRNGKQAPLLVPGGGGHPWHEKAGLEVREIACSLLLALGSWVSCLISLNVLPCLVGGVDNRNICRDYC